VDRSFIESGRSARVFRTGEMLPTSRNRAQSLRSQTTPSTLYASYEAGTSGAGWHLRQTRRITSRFVHCRKMLSSVVSWSIHMRSGCLHSPILQFDQALRSDPGREDRADVSQTTPSTLYASYDCSCTSLPSRTSPQSSAAPFLQDS
jgi:hypothetical protein